MSVAIPPDDFDPRALPQSFYEDPFPTYRRLRTEAPVLRCPDGSFFLTRYADLLAVYRDTRNFSSDKRAQFGPVFGVDTPLYEHHTTSLVFNDPPLHTRVRRAMGDALSNKAVNALAGPVESLVSRLLDRLDREEHVDLVADYASAIPVEVISGLLGVPAREREPLREWSLAILGALEFGVSPAALDRGQRAVTDFLAYLRDLVGRRQRTLTDADDDLMARLLRARREGEGSDAGLTAKELLHQCIFLLNAGHETTTNLIGNGAWLVAGLPTVREQLQSRPELIEPLVEEVLRMESPNQLGNRTAVRDTEVGGAVIPAGSILTLCIGAANRDPSVFDDPDTFRLDRAANPHLAFGSGIHTCAGLAVARLEGRIGLLRLFQRFPALKVRSVQRAHRARFRGFASLAVALA